MDTIEEPFMLVVIKWTPKGRPKVKKGVDDRAVMVSPEDVKKVAAKRVTDS